MSKSTQRTILLCTIGSAGDVNPFIGIGQKLTQRGFRVVLITSQYFENQSRSAYIGQVAH
jgi:UDP:flavonoid glycosyltransferase YjiC (YdhE family)